MAVMSHSAEASRNVSRQKVVEVVLQNPFEFSAEMQAARIILALDRFDADAGRASNAPTATRDATPELAKAEQELHEWATGQCSHWNDVHGSVTGDYPGQWERSAKADAAEIAKLTNAVIALRLLAPGGPIQQVEATENPNVCTSEDCYECDNQA